MYLWDSLVAYTIKWIILTSSKTGVTEVISVVQVYYTQHLKVPSKFVSFKLEHVSETGGSMLKHVLEHVGGRWAGHFLV